VTSGTYRAPPRSGGRFHGLEQLRRSPAHISRPPSDVTGIVPWSVFDAVACYGLAVVTRAGPWLRSYWWAVALCVVAVSGIWAMLWPLTDVLAFHDIGGITGPSRAIHLQAALEAVRSQLLTLGAGIFAAGALVYTARNFTLSRQQFELSRQTVLEEAQAQRRTLELTEQGQVADRYTKAIEQLSSDKLALRIGAIYALERIASDFVKDHPTVMEVLSAFVRERPSDGFISADIQVALTVIGRRDSIRDRLPIDLTGANLIGANLDGADLKNAKLNLADLSDASLQNAMLSGAHLDGAVLRDAEMPHADLSEASISTFIPPGDADVIHADVRGANLRWSVLVGASLSYADMSGANLTGANLTNAYLFEAQLSQFLMNANFTGADLDRAHWPHNHPIPAGWVRDPLWGVLRRADGGEAPQGE
jgi:hypothetical protein